MKKSFISNYAAIKAKGFEVNFATVFKKIDQMFWSGLCLASISMQ